MSGGTSTRTTTARILVLDNRDSFVFNLVEDLRRRGDEVLTLRNAVSLEAFKRRIERFDPHVVVLSPGPGRPEKAGVMLPWLRTRPEVPVLGICLGHQAIVVAAGGRVDKAPRLVHGRSSNVQLRPDPLFRGIPSPLVAARYHSLVAVEVPETLDVIAYTVDDGREVVMGTRHRRRCQVGLQFHPESVLTPHGSRILWRFVEESLVFRRSERESAAR